MRILVHDFAGHPFQPQLSRELARRGHDVTHAYCGGVATGRGALVRRIGDPRSLAFVDASIGDFERYEPLRRLASEVSYGRSISAVTTELSPDVVISANTPLAAQAQLWRAARRCKASRIYWLQDFLGRGTRAILSARSPALGATAGRAWESFENALLRRSDAVVAISDDFLPHLEARRVFAPTKVIENWAPLDEVVTRPKRNSWSELHRLADRPVALYSGTLGLKHDPSHLVQAAEAVGDAGEIVVVTEGRGREALEETRRQRRLNNLHLFDYVDYATLPELLGTADVCLVLLESEAGAFSVPSKLLTYLAAGRAVVAAIPPENLAARVIGRAGAGRVVRPGDHIAFGRAVRNLLADDYHRGQFAVNGRKYAEAHFDVSIVADKVLGLICQ